MSVPAAYLAVIMVWSTTPLGVKWSAHGISPAAGAFARILLATALGWMLVRLAGVAVPWHRKALRVYGYSNIGVFVGLLCTYIGAQTISSGLISIMYGMSPVISAVLARFLLNEPPFSLSKWLAMVTGVLGLVVVFRHEVVASQGSLTGFALVLFSVFCFSFSGVMLKREGPVVQPFAQTVGALTLATPLYGIAAAIMGLQIESIQPRTVGAIVYLAVFGSFVGFFCYFYILKHLQASTVALTTMITPVLAVTLGALLNGEVITHNLLAGAAMIATALLLYYWGDALFAKLTLPRVT